MSIHCYLNKKITNTALLFVLFKKKTCFIGTCFNFNEFNMLKKLIKKYTCTQVNSTITPLEGPIIV